MFATSDDLFELLGFESNNMSDIEIKFLKKFLKLPQKEREHAISFMSKLFNE